MNKFIFILIGCSLGLNLYANKCSNIDMFSHNDGNVIIHGDVDISITCQNIVKKAEVKKEEISKISQELKELYENFNTEQTNNLINKKMYNNKLKKLKSILRLKKNELSKIKKDINNYNKSLNRKLFNLKNELFINNEIYKNKIENNKEIIQKIDKDLSQYINNIDNELSLINRKLKKHEQKIKDNSKNITNNKNTSQQNSVILEQHRRNIEKVVEKQKNFSNYFNNTSDIFYGVHIGTLYLDKNFGTIVGIDIEGFNRNSSSIFTTLSGMKIDKKDYYFTLGSSKEFINNRKNYYSLEIGYKEFFDIHLFNNKDKVYLATSVGGMTGDDNSFIASVFTGFEYYNKADNKIILELGSKYINNVSYDEVVFNSLGKSSISSDKKEELTISLTLKYLWRWK